MGHGAWDLLRGKNPSLSGGHSFFEADLVPPNRTIELADPARATTQSRRLQSHISSSPTPDFAQQWSSYTEGSVSYKAIDVFHDGSLYIVDAPGHLPGHINLIANTNTGRIYLAGDACHDRRILRKEREIGEWMDTHGHICCIHYDRHKAEETIKRIRKLEAQGMEVIFAHDVEWEEDARNSSRFWHHKLNHV